MDQEDEHAVSLADAGSGTTSFGGVPGLMAVMRGFRTIPVLLALVSIAAVPSAAHAGIAGVSQVEGGDIVFSGDPGESSRLTVRSQPAHVVVFEDSVNGVTAGRGCNQLEPDRVSCASARFVIVELEDGDDEVTTAGAFPDDNFLLIDGGQGSDTIHGEAGSDSIDGGLGADRLFGGRTTTSIDAVDVVRRGEFHEMPDHAADRDEISCAPESQDLVRYSALVDANDVVVSGTCGRISLYTETFVQINGTEGGEFLNVHAPPTKLFGLGGDDSLATEKTTDRADGGAGDDRLEGSGLLLGGTGNDTMDSHRYSVVRMDGQSGNDRLIGTRGPDSLAGGSGSDTISGNSGGDLIRVRDGSRDTVNCGNGRDRVIADRRDSISSNCEVVSRG